MSTPINAHHGKKTSLDALQNRNKKREMNRLPLIPTIIQKKIKFNSDSRLIQIGFTLYNLSIV
jgi:hypothetical protein